MCEQNVPVNPTATGHRNAPPRDEIFADSSVPLADRATDREAGRGMLRRYPYPLSATC